MRLNKTMEEFYLSILDYAGMELDPEENIINKSETIGPLTLDGKDITLPYFDSLKNPNGRTFFHLLNENYTTPETSMFLLYKRRLTLEINVRLSSLVVSLIKIASDPKIQQRIGKTELVKVISDIGEADHSIVEAFLKMSKVSMKTNDEGFLVDFFLKKNGLVDDVPFAAIGKVNFKMYKEVNESLSETGGGYEVFGTKFRKKDLCTVSNVFTALFPDIDTNNYTDGTDNKIFRYLNMLLKISYMIHVRINEIGEMIAELNDETLHADEIILKENWVDKLETLYGMAGIIRAIPNQTDLSSEAKRLKLDESKAAAAQQQAPVQQPSVQQAPVHQQQAPQFVPQPPPQPTQMQQQPYQQQQPQQLSAEDIIRNRMNMGQQFQQQPMMGMQQQYPQQFQQPMQQAPLPSWMQQDLMRGQQQNPQLQQQLMQQQMLQQQQMQYPQMGFNQPQMGGQYYGQQFQQPVVAPWQS